MGRPRLRVGQHGNISFRTLAPRKVQATAYVRDSDGRRREVTATGTSNASARANLQERIDERTGATTEVSPDTKLSVVAQAWIDSLSRQVDDGTLAPNTHRIYLGALTNHVLPAVGELTVREANPSRLDRFLVTMRANNPAGITKTVRTVVSGVMGYAVRHGARDTNPVREVGRIRGSRAKAPARALTQLERDTWLARMEADDVAAHRDIPDITRFLLATGCRLGEALAVSFDEIDVDAKTVEVNYNIVRITGVGLRRDPTKSAAGERTLMLSGWAVDMLIRRGDAQGWKGPLFPVPGWRQGKPRAHGLWRDPSNTSRDFRQARARAGFDWVTSHNFRKTVATIMDEAGNSARKIADQLGHSKISMTQDHYLGRKAVGDDAAIALEDVFSK